MMELRDAIYQDSRLEPYRKLELEFGRWTGMPHMAVCSSGTAALHLALEALHLRPGARVIVPSYAMIACARAVTLAGLEPVFVDCRRDDLTIYPEHLADVLEADLGVQAIMAVHVYGRSCGMPAIVDLAMKHGCFLIEDLAEAHGLPPHPNTHAACWSFYRNKVIAGEEGGAVAFKEPPLRALACQLRNVGFTEAHDYAHVPRGHNYRLANLLAEPIRVSLRGYATNLQDRRRIEANYDHDCPREWRQSPRVVPWVYDLRIPGMRKDVQRTIVERLRRIGVEARYGFQSLEDQEEYRRKDWPRDEWHAECPESRSASREVIYLPLTPDMTSERIKKAFDTIKRTLANPSWGE